MKTNFLLYLLGILLCSLPTQSFAQSNKKGIKVTVSADIKGCWVALIPIEAAKGQEYGWWYVWRTMKEQKKYQTAPATFTNVAKGKYIIVVYNPASENFDPNNGKPEEASDGVVLEEVDIQKNASFKIKKADFKTWYCLSCPWLCLWNGQEYTKITEVIKDVVGKEAEATTKTEIASSYIINQQLKIRIQEEKEETSYLNTIVLKVGNETYLPDNAPEALQSKDERYHTLKKGAFIELTFSIKTPIAEGNKIVLETTGYYEPEEKFLAEIYQKYLRTK